MHLAWTKLEANILERANPLVGFGDVGGLEQSTDFHDLVPRSKILRLTLRISPVGSRSAVAFAHAAKPAQDHPGDAHQDNTTIKLSKTYQVAVSGNCNNLSPPLDLGLPFCVVKRGDRNSLYDKLSSCNEICTNLQATDDDGKVCREVSCFAAKKNALKPKTMDSAFACTLACYTSK